MSPADGGPADGAGRGRREILRTPTGRTAPVYVALYTIALFAATCAVLPGRDPLRAAGLLLAFGLGGLALWRIVHRRRPSAFGYARCRGADLALAALLPVAWLGLSAALGLAAGWAHPSPPPAGIPWRSFLSELLVETVEIFLLNLVMEEAIFRGYLLGALRPFGDRRALAASSLLFGLWHLPVASAYFGAPAPLRVVLYAANMTLFGAAAGFLRLRSGSLLAPALFHGAWNALDYRLFGFADGPGLFAGDRLLYDPEQGLAGLLAGGVALFCLWRFARNRANLT